MKCLIKKEFDDARLFDENGNRVHHNVGEIFEFSKKRIDEIRAVDPELIEVLSAKNKKAV